MEDLTKKKCVPCEGDAMPLDKERAGGYLRMAPRWTLDVSGKKIYRAFPFKDFAEAMVFVNKVAGIAEGEGHHPDIYIFYNKVNLELWTHNIGGLSENDFIVAAKVNEVMP